MATILLVSFLTREKKASDGYNLTGAIFLPQRKKPVMATILLVPFLCHFFHRGKKTSDGYNLTAAIFVAFFFTAEKKASDG